jgi:hypothetical protein
MECFVALKRTQYTDLHGSPLDRLSSGQSSRAGRSLESLARRLALFHARFRDCFVTRTRNVIEQSKQYLFGLIQSEKRNMERMAEVVPDSDDQVYQHFMSESPWSASALLDQVAYDADAAFGDSEDCFMVVDESAIAKKGKKSVGEWASWEDRQLPGGGVHGLGVRR